MISEIKKAPKTNSAEITEVSLKKYLTDTIQILKKYGIVIFGYVLLIFWISVVIISKSLYLEAVLNASFIIASLLFLRLMDQSKSS
ncbi:hypothetical protein SAMN04489761_1196 [Tenacibaculum sp. MAR_2009_124]|uniref:hypothetical protein n=1 Tax=Tenacibaculum sp. MAR_2009_124 TaxID=1250059 RepID=UPI000898EC6C|nr:hypothetical protein [Tenacibaculum sp. MAR_2009_124]SEB52193.1 hypothetical protein SAMN04489761_1196 [Tenacibaculum sp. MAR_2009_124]